ncbi:MAG: glutamine amidotransferase-related protein [Bryobacteraceae bacterium]
MHSSYRVGLIGEFNEQQRAHLAIPQALSAASGGAVECVWVASDTVGNGESLAEFAGLWCVPGMPYRSAEGVLRAIRHARVARTPFLGTSAGFQYALIEYARNVLGLAAADHQKSNPKAAMPLISPLGCALLGVKARVRLSPGSILRKAYGKPETVEEYRCSFGLNGRYRRLLEGQHLMVTAVDDQDEIRAVELDGHPFFVATLFQPELGAQPNPLVQAFTAVCARSLSGVTRVAS